MSADLPISPEQILAAAPDAVVVHDLEDIVRFWNQAAERLYGWSAEEIHGRPVTRIFYLNANARKEAMEQLREQGEWSGDLRQIDREGDERLIFSRQRLQRDPAGEPVAVVAFNTDVTLQRKAEDAEARAHQVRSSSLLAGGIAHELNNALAPIMLSSAMLKRSLEDEKSRKMLSMIEKCANRGAELIGDLLAFERGRGGGNELIRATQIERAIKRLKGELVPDNVVVRTEIVDILWEFRGNLEELTQVFAHIIRNACEAMPGGGMLTIQANNRLFDENFEALAPEAKAGAYVSFVFKDTGHGIEKGLLPHVAEPFFTTKEPKRGRGFGLANAQAVVKGHKGFMVMDSDRGEGTTLSIFLPADITPDQIKGSAPPFPLSEEGKGRLILVADDEFFVRETIKKTLEERGYDVLTAEDGTEALAIYAARIKDIDLVVTNVEMPFMDGAALCRALKKLKPDARILVSSGYKHPEKMKEIQAAGVEHFLPKPYTAENLANLVQRVLHESEQPS
ncbi:MAG: response regulator [Opitutales bacterium]